MPKSNKSKVTSKKAASAASNVLKDKRTSKKSKAAAGSALSQKPKNKTKKNYQFMFLKRPIFKNIKRYSRYRESNNTLSC